MSALSDYLEQSILNSIFRAQAIATLATSNYYALFTSAPSDSGGGTEASGTGYARASLTRNVTTNFDAPASGATQNATAIDYGTAGAGGWGTVLAVGVLDAITVGNLLAHGSISPSKTINANDPVSFAVGDFDFALTGSFSSYLRDVILNWLFRNGSWPTWNANVSISLHTGDPGLTGASEVSGGNYARVNVTRSTGNFSAPGVGGLTDNVNQITFPTPTGANWGLITYAGVWDGGGTNFLFKHQLAASKTVNDGDQAPYIAAGDLDITLA
jgi:hypothetical protein